MTPVLPLLCKVGVKCFMGRQKRDDGQLTINSCSRFIVSLAHPSVSPFASGLVSFIKETIFKAADQSRSFSIPFLLAVLPMWHHLRNSIQFFLWGEGRGGVFIAVKLTKGVILTIPVRSPLWANFICFSGWSRDRTVAISAF